MEPEQREPGHPSEPAGKGSDEATAPKHESQGAESPAVEEPAAAALQQEDLQVDAGSSSEASERTRGSSVASPSKGDRRVAIGLLLALVVLMAEGALVWRTRSELEAVREEVATLKEAARSAELRQARAALLRATAELQPAREALPSELAQQVERAETLLIAVAERLRVRR